MIDYMLFVPKMIEKFSNLTLETIEHGLAKDIVGDDSVGYAVNHYPNPENKSIVNTYVIYGSWEAYEGVSFEILIDEYKTDETGEMEVQCIEMNSFRDCVRRVVSMVGTGVAA